jgi:hypothetical protein
MLWGAMRVNKVQLEEYHSVFREYPVLRDGNIDFWDMKKSQSIWRNQFTGLSNLATNPRAIEIRENAWKTQLPDGKTRGPTESDHKKYLNPITGKFDWLAVGEDGKVYSLKMPNSVLIASPPIRVKDIRCPLTASDSPFYEDLTMLQPGSYPALFNFGF